MPSRCWLLSLLSLSMACASPSVNQSSAAVSTGPVGGPSAWPKLFAPGVLSTGKNELNTSFEPDGRTVYFTIAASDFSTSTIYVSRLGPDGWGPPKVAPFSGTFTDGDPFVSPDGRRLLFMSKRPLAPAGPPRKDHDLWLVERQASVGEWGPPRHLGGSLSSEADEYYPTLDREGTLYFASARPGGFGGQDLYRAKPQGEGWGEPENLGPQVNSALDEHDGIIAPDGKSLVFIVRKAPDGLGGADLYISERGLDGRFGPRRHLPAPINSTAWDFCPAFSPDGKLFYFTSSREISGAKAEPGNGEGDLYFMPAALLGITTRPVTAGAARLPPRADPSRRLPLGSPTLQPKGAPLTRLSFSR